LLEAVDRAKPRLHLYGHIHHAGGCWARAGSVLANVTTWESERAASVFDLDARGVFPIEIPPAET
jgi:Icc-related predicted phosphoesterase